MKISIKLVNGQVIEKPEEETCHINIFGGNSEPSTKTAKELKPGEFLGIPYETKVPGNTREVLTSPGFPWARHLVSSDEVDKTKYQWIQIEDIKPTSV